MANSSLPIGTASEARMQRRLKGLVMAGALVALSLTPIATASAASQPLTIDTGSYICTHGVCDLGSGNVGAFFAGSVTSFGGQGPTPYTWSVVAGSLPTDMLLTPSYGVYSAYVYGIPTTTGATTLTLQVSNVEHLGCSPGRAKMLCVSRSWWGVAGRCWRSSVRVVGFVPVGRR
ncbi:MAG TPA: hypothetical protein VIK61_11750, partial [Acidimicrobiia bacterium]